LSARLNANLNATGDVGFVIPTYVSQGLQGYINLKGYAEFGRSDRPSGWNTWLTFVISPAEAPPPATSRMITK